MKKRILAALLAAVMVLTVMPSVFAADSESERIAEAYLSVIKSRESFSGTTDEYALVQGFYNKGNGLAYAELIDFDGDGTYELYILDAKPDEWSDDYYNISEELWYWNGNSAQRAYQYTHSSTGAHMSNSCRIYLLDMDGKTYIAKLGRSMHSGVDYSSISIYGYENGSLTEIKDITEVWSTYGAESDFYYALSVDGVEIERTPLIYEFGESSEKAKELKASYPLDETKIILDGGAWIKLSWKVSNVSLLMSEMYDRINSKSSATTVSSNAQTYLDLINSKPQASSYLVDFDGDGNKELLIWEEEGYSVTYEIWQGSSKILEAEIPFLLNEDYHYCSIASSTEYPNNLFLRYYAHMRQDSQSYSTNTILNGEWATVDKAYWYEDYSDGAAGDVPDCYVNDKTFPPVYTHYYDFVPLCDAMNSKYTDVFRLVGYHSAKAEIEAELNDKTIPSDWAKAEIDKADAAGLIPELAGKPGWRDGARRVHFAQIVVQLVETVLDEKLAKAPEDTFYDCNNEAVLKAYKAGIINGIGDDKFDPKSGVSREQLATMLWRAAEYIQKRGEGKTLKKGAGLDGYADKDSVSDYAVEAVAALAENGIMKGTSETTLSPQDGCTIEQSVLLVYRLFDKIK